jgi:hypothetical protein
MAPIKKIVVKKGEKTPKVLRDITETNRAVQQAESEDDDEEEEEEDTDSPGAEKSPVGEEEEPEEAPPEDPSATDTAHDPNQPVQALPPGQVTPEAIKGESLGRKKIHVSTLLFDRNRKWGQIRAIDPARQKKLFELLKKNHPRVVISDLLVRSTGAGIRLDWTSAWRQLLSLSQNKLTSSWVASTLQQP